jgi:hypothetical protein
MRFGLLFTFLFISFIPVRAQEPEPYFIEAVVSNPNPFVGEQVIYTFRLYSLVRGRTNNAQIIWPGFEGFWRQELSVIKEYEAQVAGSIYNVKERDIVLYPTAAGSINIGPTTFLLPDDPFSRGEVRYTPPLTINARALPASADPSSFSGAVGQFEMLPLLDRQTTTAGEPVTLNLTVRGTGNVEQLPAPDLDGGDIWRVHLNASEFHLIEGPDSIQGERVFEWLLIPVQAGVQTLPPMSLTFFEPQAQQYLSIEMSPLTVDVQPGQVSQDAIPTAPTLAAQTVLAIRPLPSQLARVSDASPLNAILWLLPPLVTLVIWQYTARQKRHQQNQAYYRRTNALKRARQSLKKAQSAEHITRQHYLRETICTFVADKANLDAQQITQETIQGLLHKQGVDQATITDLLTWLTRVEASLYAPVATDSSDAQLENLSRTLAHVDEVWT